MSKQGRVFGGWSTAADGTGITYQPGDEIELTQQKITLYALWQIKPLKIHSRVTLKNQFYNIPSDFCYGISLLENIHYEYVSAANPHYSTLLTDIDKVDLIIGTENDDRNGKIWIFTINSSIGKGIGIYESIHHYLAQDKYAGKFYRTFTTKEGGWTLIDPTTELLEFDESTACNEVNDYGYILNSKYWVITTPDYDPITLKGLYLIFPAGTSSGSGGMKSNTLLFYCVDGGN